MVSGTVAGMSNPELDTSWSAATAGAEVDAPALRHPNVDRRPGEPRANPAGLRQPAAYQFHGTLVAIILVVVAVIAVVGPMYFRVEDKTIKGNPVDTFKDGDRLRVVVEITNTTDEDTAATCNVIVSGDKGLIGSAVARSQVLRPSETETVSVQIDGVTDRPSTTKAVCQPAGMSESDGGQ